MPEPYFPIGARLCVVVLFFFVCTAAFHLILVWRTKLKKVHWKIIEYIWLGFAALGLFGAVAHVRIVTAEAQVVIFYENADSAFSSARRLVDLLSSNPGAVCRTFVRSEFSPPPDAFDAAQREYDRACEWFRAVAKAIPSQLPLPPKPISLSLLPSRPDVTDPSLADTIDSFFTEVGYYNKHVEILDDLLRKAGRTGWEDSLVFLGPFLLAIALALRITKVTGEIKLERISG